MVKDKDRPKMPLTSYSCFVQVCRDELKKKHPHENIIFSEFSRKCSEKWREMTKTEKKRFEVMSENDKKRYEEEMCHYHPAAGAQQPTKGRKRKMPKDPNAPKRSMSAFFFYCSEERPKVKAAKPELNVGQIARICADKWKEITDKSKWENLAAADKARYEKQKQEYGKKSKPAPRPVQAQPKPEPTAAASSHHHQDADEDDDEDDDDDEEESDDE